MDCSRRRKVQMQFLMSCILGYEKVVSCFSSLRAATEGRMPCKGGLFLTCFIYFIPGFTIIFPPKEYQRHLATKDPCS